MQINPLKVRSRPTKQVGSQLGFRHTDQRGRRRHIPEIPHSALDELLQALETAHNSLLQPPPSLLDQSEKLERWRKDCYSQVKPVVNWRTFQSESSRIDEDAQSDAAASQSEVEDEVQPEEQSREGKEAESLTIGLIGERERNHKSRITEHPSQDNPIAGNPVY